MVIVVKLSPWPVGIFLIFSCYFIIFLMSSISLFDIIGVAFPETNIFLCIPASAADAAAVNHKELMHF